MIQPLTQEKHSNSTRNPPHTATAKSLYHLLSGYLQIESTLPEITLCSSIIQFVQKKKKKKPSNHLMIILFGPLLLKKNLQIPCCMILPNAKHQLSLWTY